MASNANLSGGTGDTTANPQNTGSISSSAQSPQSAESSTSINTEATSNPIYLQPTTLKTAPIEPVGETAKPIPAIDIVVIVILVIVAIALTVYFSVTSKKKYL